MSLSLSLSLSQSYQTESSEEANQADYRALRKPKPTLHTSAAGKGGKKEKKMFKKLI